MSLCGHSADAAYARQNIVVSGGIFDMVFDTSRQLLYMTTGGSNILLYNLKTHKFLSPIKVAGRLEGMDISADSTKLAIADAEAVNGQVWVDIIDLSTDKLTRITRDVGANGGYGTFDAAFSGSSDVVVSGALPPGYSGAGVPIYVAHLASGVLDQVSGQNAVYATEDTIVRASPDHSVVGYTAGDISNGPWGTFDVANATLATFNQTNDFNSDIAVAPKGDFYAVLAGSALVFNRNDLSMETLQAKQGAYTGAVFDTARPAVLYLSVSGGEIDMVSVSTGKVLHRIKTGTSTTTGNNGGFGPGTLRIAGDNSYLFENSGAGVVAIKLPRP